MANDITTDAYRAKLAQAVAGIISLPKIATIVVGDGGVDGTGTPKIPVGDEVELSHQVLSKAVGTPTFPTPTQAQFEIIVLPTDLLANIKISEVGLFDQDGTFAAISTFYAKATDGTTTMTIDVIVQL